MLLNEILSNIPSFNYDGELDLNIQSIPGTPYTFWVNEADRQTPHGITLSLSSDEDDGITWEIDLGEPTVASHGNYVDDHEVGQSGYEDVQWGRIPNQQNDVHVSGSTNNPILKQLIPEITKQLEYVSSLKNPQQQEQHIISTFQKVLQQINQQ